MNAFVNAIATQEARTTNGMKVLAGSGDACVNLFFNIGASRGKNIIPSFIAAFVENKELALRIAQWARDVRGGAGERKIFRDILQYLEKNDQESALKLISKVPEIGRWDDMFVFSTPDLKNAAYTYIGDALRVGNRLAAKWMPREGSKGNKTARELMAFYGMTPKQYRKSLVALSDTVEQRMCAKNWADINFSHVPSVAAARYRKAFYKNAEVAYKAYVEALTKGTDPTVKVNANAIYPHTVLQNALKQRYGVLSATDLKFITAQWNALPNYVGDASVLSIVDVSGSMSCPVGNNPGLSCIDVALSLGLYTADKNKGAFKDTFLTFSSSPKLVTLKGDIMQKIQQMNSSEWGMSTNLHAAFDKILSVAVKAKAPASDMPKTLLIMSDMQFNACIAYDDSAMEMIERKYAAAGYEVPNVVFWNLNASGNVPVKFDKNKTALISGFSPSILESVLGSKDMSPRAIMESAVMKPRYDI